MWSFEVSPVVLLVDDEPFARLFAMQILLDAGCLVLEADDAAGGFGMLQDNPDVQVLITDINMPGALNGWELVERAHTLRPDLKVIVASGALDPGAAFRPVVDDFVAKPFTAGALTEAIGQHVPIRSCSKAPSMTMLGIL